LNYKEESSARVDLNVGRHRQGAKSSRFKVPAEGEAVPRRDIDK
jgi:hypothetical protein